MGELTVTDVIRGDAIDASFAPRRRPNVAAVELDGEAVLYDEDSGAMHLLDPIATIVWKCFDGSANLEDLSFELAAAFDADEDVILADVLALARQLGRQGLLEGVEPDPEVVAEHVPHDPTPEGPAGDDC